MTRIIGGDAGGRRLQTPPGDGTRPTSDRVREALFSALESRLGSMHGLRFLDLYAGSGAVGLEGGSRGADAVTLVESDRRTATLIEANARVVGCSAQVLAQPVTRVLAAPPRVPYDVAFLDPPYPLGEEELAEVLALLVANDWLVEGAVVVVERSRRSVEPDWPVGLGSPRMKKYGETVLWYVLRAQPGEAGIADMAE